MSTASSIEVPLYSRKPPAAGHSHAKLRASHLLLLTLMTSACKEKPIADNPEEHGKLNEISANLEKAFGTKPLPSAEEPASLAARLRNWVDFRDCAVKTYVARRSDAQRARENGYQRPSHHASIGDETVEECAVRAAVAKPSPRYCQRLEVDFKRDDGEPPLSALRCWDTRARVLGLPEECPLIWLPSGAVGRNAECLAMAHRDDSFCPFAPSPSRCKALVAGDVDMCVGAPSDCGTALKYWQELIPKKKGPRVFDDAEVDLAPATPPAEQASAAPSGLKLHLMFASDQRRADHFQVQAPLGALGISWPKDKGGQPAGVPPADPRWATSVRDLFPVALAAQAAEIAFVSDHVSLRLVFVPAGQTKATLPLRPPGAAAAPATLLLVVHNGEGKRLICMPAPETKGTVSFEAHGSQPGSFVTGSIDATTFPCDDGSTARLQGPFRAAITNTR